MAARTPTTLLSRFPPHPLLLAGYAVLFLYAENLSEVLLIDVVEPLVRGVLAAVAVLAVLAVVFRDARRGAIVASALVIAFFAYGHTSPGFTDMGLDDRGQLAVWGLIVATMTVYAARAKATLPLVTHGLDGIAVILVLLASATILPYEASRAARAPAQLGGAVATRMEPVAAPDIYFLVFDRYGSAGAIERRFGLTEDDLTGWLEARGFQIPADSRANYRATDFSLAATLNMRYLDHLTDQVGRTSSDRTPAAAMLREHEVGRLLKSQGYRYYHIGSWFGPTAANPLADESLSFGVSSEFEAVLRDTTVLPAVERLLGVEHAEPTFRDRHREGALFQFRQLRRLATAPGPKFIFAHILLPHDPYVFREDGSTIPEAEARAEEEADLFAGQLAFLNGRIKETVDELLAGPEETDPIVILQADEGPTMCRSIDCPTDTPEYFAIRFGILNAMYLPRRPGIDPVLPRTFSSVNTFRMVFREYFGADLAPLPDRSFTWPDNDHVYDFRDITDRIPVPAARSDRGTP